MMTTRKPVALSGMHHMHVAQGANMVESDGWQRPSRYTSVEEESDRLREFVGICDISPVGKINIQGEDIDSLLGTAFPDVKELDIGHMIKQRSQGADGRQDVVLARLAADELMVLTPPNKVTVLAESLGQASEQRVHPVDVTSGLAAVKIAGPLSPRLLSAVTELNTFASAFPDMTCAQGKVAEVHGLLLRRDFGALTSFELYFGREYGEYMWDVLMEAGAEYSITPFGTETLARFAAHDV